jgi:hypothetical protein
MKFGFCGPSYQSQSLAEDAQSCINLYLEHDESGTGKSEWSLLHTPGLSQFATLPGMTQVRNVLISRAEVVCCRRDAYRPIFV